MEVLNQHNILDTVYQRLLAVQACPEICLSGQSALTVMLAAKDSAYKAGDALRELLEHLQDMQSAVPDAEIPAALLDEIVALLAPLAEIAQSLQELCTKLQSAGYPLVLRGTSSPLLDEDIAQCFPWLDEYRSLVSARELFAKIADCLRRWSTESMPLLSRFTRPVLTWLEGKQFELAGAVSA